MPSSAASAAMLRGFWAKLNASSVMLMWKCLAMWRRPSTAPTAWPIAAAPRNGRPARGGELLDRRSPHCGDPIEPRRAQRLLDARAGQQPAVADHHHALQLEALLQLVDLRRQRHRIGGIALEHLDCDRAAVGCAHQANDNLRPVATVVATVAMLRQFAAAPFEIEPAPAKAGVEVTS